MAGSRLPQELVDDIINILHEDRSALLRCSVVCRSWVPSSQRHLFRCITFIPAKMHGRGVDPVSSSKRLYRVLLKSPHISHYIQQLRLDASGRLMPQGHWDFCFAADHTLPLVLRKLSKLQQVQILHLCWNELTVQIKQSLRWVLQLPSVTFIEIMHSSFRNVDNFANFISHARGLVRLSLSYIRTSDSRSPIAIEDPEENEDGRRLDLDGQRHLSDLYIKYLDGRPEFIDHLLEPRSPFEVSRIQTLGIDIINEDDEDAVNRLLRAIGSSLKHLRLTSRVNVIEGGSTNTNLVFNSNIKCLYINIGSVDGFLPLLSTINTSNQLEQLTLELSMEFIMRVDWPAWGEQVDGVLSGARFKFLQQLDIMILADDKFYQSLVGATCKKLAAALSLLRERGISVEAH